MKKAKTEETQQSEEMSIMSLIHKVETELDQLVKDMYQNRLDKRTLIIKLQKTQNPIQNEKT